VILLCESGTGRPTWRSGSGSPPAWPRARSDSPPPQRWSTSC
jgi:hypothetical protein